MFIFVILSHRMGTLVLIWRERSIKLHHRDEQQITFVPRIWHMDRITIHFKSPQTDINIDDMGKPCVEFNDELRKAGGVQFVP